MPTIFPSRDLTDSGALFRLTLLAVHLPIDRWLGDLCDSRYVRVAKPLPLVLLHFGNIQ